MAFDTMFFISLYSVFSTRGVMCGGAKAVNLDACPENLKFPLSL